jgi:hypothetical protein
MPKIISYTDKGYQQKKAIYDSISQVISDMKHECGGRHGWNLPVEQVSGVTSRFVSDSLLELTYHRFEVCTVEGLARKENDGPTFLAEVVKELKKRFRKHTKKNLNLKKVKEGQAIDKTSRIQADTSWMLGSSRYGYGARPVGRYLIRDSCVYEFDVDLLG